MLQSTDETDDLISCVQLFFNPMDCSPSGSSFHGILQVRILQWVAFPFSRGSSQPREWTWVSGVTRNLFIIWATRKALSSASDLQPLWPDFVVLVIFLGQCSAGDIPQLLSNRHLLFIYHFIFWPCCEACGILVPQSGIAPLPPAVEAPVFNTGCPTDPC